MHLSQRSLQRAAAAQVNYMGANVAEVLFAILTSLVRIRGAKSCLFSSLLQKSESILGLDAVPPAMNLDLPLDLDCHNRLVEWATTQANPLTGDKCEETADFVEIQASGRACGIPHGD